MKCVYCNTEKDLTVSDIIPYALTGAKVQKRFVCRTHNSFTNDHYEKQVNANFAVYRNLLGLTERDGDPVRFFADLNIGGHTVKAVVSDKADHSALRGSRQCKCSPRRPRCTRRWVACWNHKGRISLRRFPRPWRCQFCE